MKNSYNRFLSWDSTARMGYELKEEEEDEEQKKEGRNRRNGLDYRPIIMSRPCSHQHEQWRFWNFQFAEYEGHGFGFGALNRNNYRSPTTNHTIKVFGSGA